MKQYVYSIYDSKAEAYLRPFFTTTKGLALREFVAAANETGQPLNMYPSDYTLFEMGTYDTQSGRIEMHDTHINMGLAIEHLRTNPDNQLPPPSLQDIPSLSKNTQSPEEQKTQ